MINNFLLFGFLFLLPFTGIGQIHKITIEGEIQFNQALLHIDEAGLDYTSSLEAPSALNVTVDLMDPMDNKNKNSDWLVKIHKQDINWNEELKLEIQRTGTGSKKGSSGNVQMNGSEAYVEIRNNEMDFFWTRGEIEHIPFSVKISQYSVPMGASDFETMIVFTVYDN